jgi:bacterioferritin
MAQFNNFNQQSNSNFENNQSQNQNPNMGMNQGNNQNSNVNYGHNQGQNNGPFGNTNQRQNQNRNQYQYQNQNQNQNQNQSQNLNQYGNQGQNQTSSQHTRNQRNPFGFNRFGNSYSNYYNNPNNDLNQENSGETPIVNNEAQIINNEPQTINKEAQIIHNENQTSGNTRSRSNYRPNMNQAINNKNIIMDNPVNNKQNDNINQISEATINPNSNSPKLDNENLNNNNVTPTNYNKNENNQFSDENSNHTRRMTHHNSELNTASMKNSFEINDGGTPVIKLGGQYGFNLEKKMNVEHGIVKQGNEPSNVFEEDVLKISSVALAERKHSHNKLYCSDKPYPNIEVSGENVDYAVYLLNDYAGLLSELTAITSYSFLNLILDDEYQEIKDTYLGIAIVEMRHLHMLGEMIKKLGVLPRYYARETNQITMWNSNYVSGETDMKTTLLNSIKNEEAGIVQYQKRIELIDDENIKVVLARIVLDEEVHVSLLQDLYKKYCPE